MPVPSILISSEIRAASVLIGPSWISLTEGIGLGVMKWLHANPANVFMTGAVPVGAAGAGMVSGKLVCPPNPGIIMGACLGAGIAGVQMPEIANAVAVGVSTAISKGGLYQGGAVGVSGGADVSKCLCANSGTLIADLMTGFTAMAPPTGPGVLSISLATGLGNGIAGMLLAGLTGTGIVAPVTPAPAVAAGSSPTSIVV